MPKITALTAETALATGDLFAIVDVNDTTQSANGSTNKMTAANVAKGLSGMQMLDEVTFVCSDEDTAIDSTGQKFEWVAPFDLVLTGAPRPRACVNSADTSALTIDIEDDGVSVLSTGITIDAGETSSEDAGTPPVLSSTTIAKGSVVTVDLDSDGDGTATGLKVTLFYYGTLA